MTPLELVKTYFLKDLKEDDVWSADVQPHLSDLPKNALEIWEYSFTEMLNNAIDHSEGEVVSAKLARAEGRTRILLLDDGIGIFLKVQRVFNLEHVRHAVLEVTKGITTDPDHHSGQGIFMVSRLMDSFNIFSRGVQFRHSGEDFDSVSDYANEDETGQPKGTAVLMELDDNTSRTMEEISVAVSTADGVSVARTVVPVQLARLGNENLVSRSQAKRLLAGLDRFEAVVLDFAGINKIGQAFADQIFRVFAKDHPGVVIIPINANEEVVSMIAYTAQVSAQARKPQIRATGTIGPPPEE